MLASNSPRLMLLRLGLLTTLLVSLLVSAAPVPTAQAAHTPDPTSVTIAGSLQSELGCAGDWDPACAATHLTYDAADDVWQGTWTVPAGSYEYKAALNDSWDENYGLHAAPGGANIPLNLGAAHHRQVLLRPQDPLGHRQSELGDRHRARQLPERAGLPRRLGAGLPALLAAGPGRRWHLQLLPRPPCRPATTKPRSPSTKAGT